MLTIHDPGVRLCDRLTRREVLRAGGLGSLGLSLPELWNGRARAASSTTNGNDSTLGRAKSCIILFLMGGPAQHSTWDPKPDAPPEVRGEFGPIATSVPGIQIAELLPKSATQMDKVCILRAMTTNDNAHSSSGYYMLTGVPHQPMNAENVNPGAPNNYPSVAALVQKLGKRAGELPTSIRLPHHIFNTDSSVWPGQDAGFLGHSANPWLFKCHPASADFQAREFSPSADTPSVRLDARHSLLKQVNSAFQSIDVQGGLDRYDRQMQQAFTLLGSQRAREAFRIDQESTAQRDRYGRGQFGQSVLLARRLIGAGVSLVQVNWFRGPDEPVDNPCWDSHIDETNRLKTVLAPAFDQAYSALLQDLTNRGLLDETLVVCMSEFGRTPTMNARAGRDHWGHVFSVALAGGGIQGGQIIGASDKNGAYPNDNPVQPQDLTATILHALGLHPDTEIRDALGRPLPASRGKVVHQIF